MITLMTTMNDGLLVTRVSDEVYEVRDARRVLGGVVRFWVSQPDGTAAKRFRAFGEDFGSLSAAVGEFLKARGVVPFDAKGDAVEFAAVLR